MRAIKYFSFILLLIFSSTIYSQIPDTVWTKTFGGPLTDVGNSVKQANDGGFIIAATTNSFGAGGQDIYLIKTDENGDTLWTKTFGGTGNDKPANVVQTNDSGYAIFGTTNSFGNGGDDFLLWKTDSLGNMQWFNTYGGTANESAYEGQQLSDGTYIIVGDSIALNIKALLIKTDENGILIWSRTVGTSFYEDYYYGHSVLQTNDGGYALCGTHRYHVGPSFAYEYSFTKISSDGDSLYYKYYGMYVYAFCNFVRKLPDGNLLICGSVGITDAHPWIVKTTQSGNSIWQKTVLGSQSPVSLTDIKTTNDNGFIMTVGLVGTSDFQLIKVNESGLFSWEKVVGGPLDDRAYTVSLTSGNGYIVTGYTKSFGAGDSDVWLIKFNYYPPPEITVVSPNGGELWLMGDTVNIKWNSIDVDSVKIQLSLSNGIDWLTIIDSTPSDSLYEWIVQAPSTSLDCLLKISNVKDSTVFDISDTTFVIDMFPSVDESIVPEKFGLYQNFPNPFNPVTKIKFTIPSVTLRQAQSDILVSLKVYDILGNEIATLVNEEKQPGTYEVEFNSHSGEGRNLTSGIYFYQLRVGSPETSSGQGFSETKKMILMK